MFLTRFMLAGLLLALPTTAVFSQDNPWHVPSAPNGYVPGYAVQEHERALGTYSPSEQPRGWSQQPTQFPAPAYPHQQQEWGQDPGLYAGYQWPAPQRNGYPAYQNQPRQQRQAAVNPNTRYDVPAQPPPVTGSIQRWNSPAGAPLPRGPTYEPSYGTPSPQRAPINQYPPYGGYGEYPPLDGDPATLPRRDPPDRRESTNQPSVPTAPQPAGSPALYGPSTLTAPYPGLPGLGGYGYGGHYGYPARPYGWGW